MNLNLVNEITKDQLKTDLPEIKAGMTVRVDVRIKEGDKSRIQAFEGVVIKVQGSGIRIMEKNWIRRRMFTMVMFLRQYFYLMPSILSYRILRLQTVRIK